MIDKPHEYTDQELDETIEESFPASDAPANTVETGVVPRELPSTSETALLDNRTRSRFELVIDGQTAFLDYKRSPLGLTLVHTEVPENLRGRGFGTTLVKRAVEIGRAEGLRIIAECKFAKAILRKH
jgi:uncharacterized protein